MCIFYPKLLNYTLLRVLGAIYLTATLDGDWEREEMASVVIRRQQIRTC